MTPQELDAELTRVQAEATRVAAASEKLVADVERLKNATSMTRGLAFAHDVAAGILEHAVKHLREGLDSQAHVVEIEHPRADPRRRPGPHAAPPLRIVIHACGAKGEHRVIIIEENLT